MEEGTASYTARAVAARRLGFERVPSGYGDPEADLALARDVADGLVPAQSRMGEYIRARTAFFDRVVVAALDGGMSQVVVGAAGYDGRSLRYAKPGVRWFEVDHPATQDDKLERLARLGIDTRHVGFVAADFAKDQVAGRLLEAGLDAARPALFLFEGIAVYLEDSVTESVLAQFRQVTGAGGQLAISVSTTAGAVGRSGFRARVAALGEPARSVLGPGEAEATLARAGWQVDAGRATQEGEPATEVARQARRRAAGLLTARAVARGEHGRRAAAGGQDEIQLRGPAPLAIRHLRPRAGPRQAAGGRHRRPARREGGKPATGGRPSAASANSGGGSGLAGTASPRCASHSRQWPPSYPRRSRTACPFWVTGWSAGCLRTATRSPPGCGKPAMRLPGCRAAGVGAAVAGPAGVHRRVRGPVAGAAADLRRRTAGTDRALARAAYLELAAGIEGAWRHRFGTGRLSHLRGALEHLPARDLLAGTEPYPEGWRAQVRSPDVLPHYPMVLHRGGYPDGS